MSNQPKLSRRKSIKMIGGGIVGGTGILSQSVSAKPGSQKEKKRSHGKKNSAAYLRSFDPADPEEREKAIGHLAELESREKAEHILTTLPQKRKEAIKQALGNFRGFEMQMNHKQLDEVPESLSSNGVTAADTSRTYLCRGVLKNSLGGTEAVFDHYVHWEYPGGSVENFSHWKEVSAGGWLVYWNGMTTNYIDNRDDHGVSKMAGTFNACITSWGCYASEDIGSGIWVYPNGQAACNEWDDSTT